ncbi:hypothetical protein Kpol_530p28 [Vanderwaltozyma polyspora DSM 70294]|uniref:Proteasome assembly chaperone 1 n=1 Tax=Vanderwaltozyma polyspora (strain ATCC 22028 / DSM 70294 / BCRC 21397 / CBS 2163 / NBRC 10782 / NRRL Y-8283 / UCD 57-17) TaxID=436907 RepID=A7TL02_VANPO|nr:uncharacterized protein Kpol_530p28 [Vanderwaltozyma polyspora DSM 70294]EDO17058.1 hypothetical protein Kpol_530p28 [Vanderwaltozyma polyspora DSM 70294]
MLFKQWNEFVAPRHELDSPIIARNDDSLQLLSLPEVHMPETDLSKYKNVVLTTKIMDPLFPSKLLSAEKIADITTTLKIDESQDVGESENHSWDYEENFPNEVGFKRDSNNRRLLSFSSPIFAFKDTIIIMIEENFIKMSAIFSNVIAEQVINHLLINGNPDLNFIAIGTSDRILNIKKLTQDHCSLEPPEFVTGFIGSILTQLISKEVNVFTGILAPSEGPIGFEKMTLDVIKELIDICQELLDIKSTEYSVDCQRMWRLDGAAIGAQSGLYI